MYAEETLTIYNGNFQIDAKISPLQNDSEHTPPARSLRKSKSQTSSRLV
jgi:hypothetical protein